MRKITIIAALAIVAMASCTKENSSTTTTESQAIEFVSESIATRVNSAGDEWTAGDQIGVYMLDAAKNIMYTNYQYEALTGGESTTLFVPADVDVEALEYGEAEMSFYAYYPYTSGFSLNGNSIITEIDCSDQSNADFLWAEKLGAYRGDVISLPFEHKMSRLELVITPLDNIYWLSNLQATITGVLTKGECSDIAKGEVVGLSSDDVELTFATDNTEELATISVIFFPQTLASAATITIVVSCRTYTIEIPSGTEFLSGKLHRYYATVGNDYAEFVGENTISEWSGSENGDDLYGSYNQ